MRWRATASMAGAVVFLACGTQRTASSTAPDHDGGSLPVPPASGAPSAPTSPATATSSSAPVSSAPPAAPSSAPAEPAVACATACAAGTACALTNRGPACVECAPGSLPTCKDDRFVAVCGDDGSLKTTTDCFAQSKRCASGTCMSRECTPNALHCFEGNVQRCNATGTGRTLVKTCQIYENDVGFKLDEGVCQVRRGVPDCHTDCFEPHDSTILALFGCTPCEPPPGEFCSPIGKHGCNDRICRRWPEGTRSITGPWGAEGACRRETDGLTVPGSDRRGACEGAGPIGARVISYEVCRGGHPVAATRSAPCTK